MNPTRYSRNLNWSLFKYEDNTIHMVCAAEICPRRFVIYSRHPICYSRIMNKPRLLSGMKPTGIPHLGNYFGALKQWVDIQNTDRYDCYFMIADYHALNFIQDASQMRELTLELARTLIAIGIDPSKVTIFKQSEVSAHTELTWIFDTITTMPYLMRAHAFKDAEARDKEINIGTFNYPMLMSADILLYDTVLVDRKSVV